LQSMRNVMLSLILLVGCILFCNSADAEVVQLKSGARMKGSIVFQNEEVVVIKDATGSRFQYMMSDVEAIVPDEVETQVEEDVKRSNEKKVAVGISVSEGVSILGKTTGNNLNIDLSIGTANLFDRRIFLGGSFGYHGSFINKQAATTFLPIMLRAEVPLMKEIKPNAAMLTAGVGYGIAATKNMKGGFCADMSLGWRHEMSNKGRALFLGGYTRVQSAQLNTTETIDEQSYVGYLNRTFIAVGARLTLYL